jgi:hypothetical protein
VNAADAIITRTGIAGSRVCLDFRRCAVRIAVTTVWRFLGKLFDTAGMNHDYTKAMNPTPFGVFLSFVVLSTLLPFDACAQGPTRGPRDPAASFQTAVAQGSVTQYLMNPDGYVDGLLLADNTIIRFPPHLGQVLTQTVSPKDLVRVEGFSESPGILPALSIIDLQSQRSVIDTPPSARYPPPSRPGTVARQPLSASGTIRVLTRGKRGEVDGVVLSDGTMIRFPPPAGTQFAALLREGNPLAATGNGISNQYGRSFEATAIGPSMNQLETIALDHGLKPKPGTEP